MNIGGGQIRGVFFNFFIVKKCPFRIFWTVSNIIPKIAGVLCNSLSSNITTTKNFMARLYGWGSTTSRSEPLQRGNLLFAIKFPEIPGTHFIDHGRMKG